MTGGGAGDAAGAEPATDAVAGSAVPPLVRSAGRLARRHGPFVLLCAAGLALRVVATLAYRPALFFVDSLRYLYVLQTPDPGLNSPLGYSYLLLAPLLHAVPSLLAIPVVQHLLGLLVAVAAYAFLLRRGAWPWLAALATAPVLLDAYQLQIEQLIMSDSLFVALLVLAVLLLGRSRPGPVVATVAGVVLAAAGLTRLVGLACGVVAVAYLLAAGGPARRRLVSAGCLVVGLAAPLGVYATYYHAWHGEYRLHPADAGGGYARVAPFADCRRFTVPAYERVLCESTPPSRRPGPEFYHWSKDRPQTRLRPPPGMTGDDVLRDFTRRVVLAQPVQYAGAVGYDLLRGFWWSKDARPGEPAVERWWFPSTAPVHPYSVLPYTAFYGGGPPRTDDRLAGFLAAYQQQVFLRGTLVGLCGLLALLGALGAGRARRSGLRAVCALALCLPGITLVVAATLEFSWRYQLPAIVLFPVAGALGATAMVRGPRPVDAGRAAEGVGAAGDGTTSDHVGRNDERAPVSTGDPDPRGGADRAADVPVTQTRRPH